MNRKMIKSIITALFMTTFISCAPQADEYGLYNNIEDATKVAQKNNQDILVIVTMENDDAYSSDFISSILHSEQFKNEVASNYAVLAMDFGQATYEKTVVKETDSKSDQKKSAKLAEVMQKNSFFATKLDVRVTPSFYLLSKENYFISQLDYAANLQTVDEFKELLAVYEPAVEDIHRLAGVIQNGTTNEKIAAIDELYNYTEAEYKIFLKDAVDKLLSLDKKDESGFVSKYLLVQADLQAVEYYQQGDIILASQTYAKVCQNKKLDADQRQQAYYMAAYLLSIGGSDDYQTVLQFLYKAIEASPESVAVGHIQQIIDSLEQIVNSVYPPEEPETESETEETLVQ